MNAQWRLDSKAPSVAKAFRRSTPEKQRRAALVACEMTVPMVGLDGPDVAAGLAALRDGRLRDVMLQERLAALARSLDDEYFRLDDEDEQPKRPEVLRVFSQARAASALAIALSADAGQLHEAVYEALSSVFHDSAAVERAVATALTSAAS